jgi:hypothetical protein
MGGRANNDRIVVLEFFNFCNGRTLVQFKVGFAAAKCGLMPTLQHQNLDVLSNGPRFSRLISAAC